MTTRRAPLCQVKGCEHRSDPDYHHCFVCGKEAVDHHHFPSRAQAGKGAKVVAVLCRNHHEKITLHQWHEGVYDHPDGSVRYYVQNQKGEEQCERIIEAAPAGVETARIVAGLPVLSPAVDSQTSLPAVKEEGEMCPNCMGTGEYDDQTCTVCDGKRQVIVEFEFVEEPLPPDLTQYSDEQLATLFAWADKQQKDSFLTKCQVVHAYRERHVQHWGGTWLEHAYALFEGAPSRRTLEAYANIWGIVNKSDASLLEYIGPLTDSRNLMAFIGRKNPEDGRVALETAVAHLAKFGEPPTVPALQHKLGEESKPPERCPKTGLPHDWQRVCRDCRKEKP